MAPTTLYAVPWCTKCHRVRTFLDAAGVPYVEVDPDADPDARQHLADTAGGDLSVPAVQVGGQLLLNPDDTALAEALQVPVPDDLDVYDVIVVGGGPAGLTAAIYTTRERLRTLVLEKGLPGGQAAATGQIENYPGFPDPVSGAELMQRVQKQVEKFGAELRTFEEVSALGADDGLLRVTAGADTYRGRSVILATGSVYRRMGVPGEEELIGRGVSFCATCDAPFFRGKHVVVVGGGNSALQETLHLAEFAARITLVQLLDQLTGSPVLEQRVRSMPGVEVLLGHRITRVLGSDGVEGVQLEPTGGGASRDLPCDGVFVFIGLVPNTEFLKGTLDLDETGFVVADPSNLATTLPGVFAAGDLRAGSAKQITSAVGEGTVASFMVKQWLETRRAERAGEP
ncbi:MAG TPA: FAD-dependent oxidoreductase [Deferrisomatales bacterium]|nr:FAD-dependent oxidoreductase [Deferrisomatales bacterium]